MVTELTLESLGLSREEVCDRVVERLCDGVIDEEGFCSRVEVDVQKTVDAAVNRLAEEHILPNVTEYVENLTLQETNKWGEAKGKTVTFIEYLVQRAEAWMTETVNYQGKTKGEDSYSWKANGTRIEHMIHEHLQYSISTAMKQALGSANGMIVGGLEKAVKIKLDEIVKSLKVTVKT